MYLQDACLVVCIYTYVSVCVYVDVYTYIYIYISSNLLSRLWNIIGV